MNPQLLLDLELKRDSHSDHACLSLAHYSLYPELTQSAASFLHPRELAYFNSLSELKRKTDFLMGRYAAKLALKRLIPGAHGSDIDIRPGVFQQPLVTGPACQGVSVCITHSAHLSAALAFPTSHPVGIDLEAIEASHLPSLQEHVETSEFPADVRSIDEDIASYTRAWTIKEALSKVLRCGLMTPFSVLRLADDGAIQNQTWSGGFENFHQYRYLSLASPKFAFALVHPGRTQPIIALEQIQAFVS